MKILILLSVNGWVKETICFFEKKLLFQIGFYLFHESMLESVIYARDHFLHPTDDSESIHIFPSHAYLVCLF